MLDDTPDRFHVVTGKSPVAFGVQVAQSKRLHFASHNARDPARDLPRHKVQTAAWRFMVKENSVARKHAVGHAVHAGEIKRSRL